MIQSYTYPNLVNLSDGHYMVMKVSDAMISNMWCRMSRKEREEFERVYGEEDAFDCFVKEIRRADHSAAFYCGQDLTCLMWADWIDVKGLGRKRVFGCVCSDFAIKHPINFVKHSAEVRDAFLLFEPSGVDEVYVFITEDFTQSKEWAVRTCGFEAVSDATAPSGAVFSVFKYRMGV